MESGNFLPEKYPNLAGTKPIERAVDKSLRQGEQGPKGKEDRIERYLSRLDHIVEDERGWELLKHKIIKEFSIDADDEETLTKVAHGLYESEKRIAIEQGRGRDVENLGNDEEIINKYKTLVHEKQDIQEKSLQAWLDYLQANDAEYPTWFRYFVVRNLEKMGSMDKERGEYTKRTPHTVAPFPELNSEALGFVYRVLTQGIGHEFDDDESQKGTIESLIKKKDFSKLYTFAQIETAGQLNKESIEGEWVKYDQGSDHHILENALRGKGTGWCTAEGSAYAHLQGGDFYVYYSKGPNGMFTEPRIAIRMDGDSLGEVRGVNQRQELEPALISIAEDKYHSLHGGEKYDKKSHDMKVVTNLTKKQEKGEQFTKNDLTFLYELNFPIEGFGYQKDPRIEELRKQRNLKEDLPIIFECTSEQIAYNKEDLNENTKAYIGEWSPQILKFLPESVIHIYESFPDKKVFFRTLETDFSIQSPEEAEKALLDKGYEISDWAKGILSKVTFNKEGKTYNLVSFSVSQLGFPNGATLQEIYEKAQELGLELCPAEVGPQLRLQYPDQSNGEYLSVAMNSIFDSEGNSNLFNVKRDVGELWLDNDDGRLDSRWYGHDRFVFLRRKAKAKVKELQ